MKINKETCRESLCATCSHRDESNNGFDVKSPACKDCICNEPFINYTSSDDKEVKVNDLR